MKIAKKNKTYYHNLTPEKKQKRLNQIQKSQDKRISNTKAEILLEKSKQKAEYMKKYRKGFRSNKKNDTQE